MDRSSSYGRFAALLMLALLNQQLPAITSQPQETSLYPNECPYPCLPPPTIVPEPETNCPPSSLQPPPPPSQPSTQPPPSYSYPPNDGSYIPYFPPPWYQNNAPPPPDPILPYFPWYYKHPLYASHSSPSDAELADIELVIQVLGFVCSALFL